MNTPVNLLLLLVFAMGPGVVHAQFDHSPWDQLLRAHVEVLREGRETRVDYAGMQEQSEVLASYLDAAAGVTARAFDAWSQPERLAFLINIYNAATVDLVLTRYPGIDSIRDIGSLFRSPWSRPIVSLFGGQVSLDEIEHEMIRDSREYNEPRIHFAVNCAAIGCPPLRAEAYVGPRLEHQLDDSTRLFLSDRTRNYAQDSRLYLSKIFDWYREDFERGWQGINSVAEFLAPYANELDLDSAQRELLREGEITIRYLRYDWVLNTAR